MLARQQLGWQTQFPWENRICESVNAPAACLQSFLFAKKDDIENEHKEQVTKIGFCPLVFERRIVFLYGV